MRELLQHQNIKKIGLGLIFLGVAIALYPKSFTSLPVSEKITGTILFLAGAGITLLARYFFKKIQVSRVKNEERVKAAPTTRNYQQLLEETERCNKELKKHKRWTLGCLLLAWIVVLVAKSGGPQYSNPFFAAFVFALAFLIGTLNLEKEKELDSCIVDCTKTGIEIEKTNPRLKSSYFHEFAESFKGWGMAGFVFIRVSPALWILFSGLNAGALNLLAEVLPKSMPWWTAHAAGGLFLGMVGLALGILAMQPYITLQSKTTTGKTL